MPDLNAQVAPGQPQQGQPQAGDLNATQNTNPATDNTSQVDDGAQETSLTLEQALRELAKVRREAAEHRTVRRTLEAEKAEIERAKLSKEEQLAARLSDAERERNELMLRTQERMLQYETKLAASDLGIIDPDAAVKLLDASRIEFADDGTPKNLSKLLKELVAAKPYLVAQQNSQPTRPSASPTNPASDTGRTMTFTDKQIAAMSPQEYKQHKAAIMQAYREGRILPN